MKKLIYGSIIALVAGLIGCTTTSQEPDEAAPAFPDEAGQNPMPGSDEIYADGPFGFDVGSILPNMKFIGYADYLDANNVGLQEIRFSQFYNPTGDGMYPEGSPFGSGPLPKAVSIETSSVWCGPCNYMAGTAGELPAHWLDYSAKGGHIMVALIDGPDPGDAATTLDLFNWAEDYSDSNLFPGQDDMYTLMIDPASQLMPFYEPAFPSAMIVRTSDMKIIRVEAGVPQDDYWNTFDQVLDGTFTD